MNPPGRRRAAVQIVRPGTVPLPSRVPLQEQQRSSAGTTGCGASLLPAVAALPQPQPAPKALTKEELAAYALEKKLERQQKREEEEAWLRATKMAAVASKSSAAGPSSAPTWNPSASAATRQGTQAAHSGGSQSASHVAAASAAACGHAGSKPPTPAGSCRCSGSNGSTHDNATSRREEERQSVSNAAVLPGVSAGAAAPPLLPAAALAAPADPAKPPTLRAESSSSGWSPRKRWPPGGIEVHSTAPAAAPKHAKPAPPLQPPPHQQVAKPSKAQASRAASRALAKPAAAATLAGILHPPTAAPAALAGPPAAAAEWEEEDVSGLEAGEVEARRAQQLIGWGALLVQAAANVVAERVLLGPAAQPDSQAASAAELPISFGQRPPAHPVARTAAIQGGVVQALEALDQQRQLKLALMQAADAVEGDRQLLAAEAAADLQAQSLLVHWGVQMTCEARQCMREGRVLSGTLSTLRQQYL